MKGLILSGGLGTRLRPLTFTQPKQVIPIANKPTLFYAIEAMVKCNIREIGIIVGDRGPEVRNLVGDGSRWGATISYIYQGEPLGLAHAVKTARNFLGNDPFIMFLGDNLINSGLGPVIEAFQQANAVILVSPVQDPSRYGIVELDGEMIISLVEKPQAPKSNLALVGVYAFDSNIFQAIDLIKPSWRNELEITDAIQMMVNMGFAVKPCLLSGWWKDTGKVEDILDANRLVLSQLQTRIEGVIDSATVITGSVEISPTARVTNCVIRGPVSIGEGAVINNTYVGPYTSLGNGVVCDGVEIENSVVLENCLIKTVAERLDSCLLGRNARILGHNRKPKVLSLILSDDSAVYCRHRE